MCFLATEARTVLLEWALITLQLHSDRVGHSETQHPEGCSATVAKLSVPNVRNSLIARSDFRMWIFIFLESLYNISQTVPNAACSLQGLSTPQKPPGNLRRPGYTLEKTSVTRPSRKASYKKRDARGKA